jgi:hypothetical protein
MKTAKLIMALFVLSAASLYVYASDNSVVTKTFKVNKGGHLKVEIMSGDINIHTWNRNEVTVKVDGVDEEDRNLLNISQSGNTINVDFKGSGSWGNNDVEISVPEEFNLNLNTNSGDVNVNNNVTGTVQAYSAGGDISLKDVKGKTNVKTNGGDINTGNISGDLRLSTNGGDVEVGNITGMGVVRTMGGSININNVSKDLDAKTFGGDIDLGSVGGNAKVSTMGGSISAGKIGGSADVHTNGGNIKLSGANGYTKAKTLGGNISLYNISGNIDASTASGDVYAELKPSGSGKTNISTLSGRIKLLIDPNAKATIHANVKMGGSEEDHEKMIESDFPAQNYEKEKYGVEVNATYLINGGGDMINLSTINDRIEIRKLKK